MKRNRIACVIPNFNGKATLGKALDSLFAQQLTSPAEIIVIVVDNASTDGSSAFVKATYPQAQLVQHNKNYGFTGGVNRGIREAMAQQCNFIALFNNDAVAAPDWLQQLYANLLAHPTTGIATGKLLTSDRTHIDSTGEWYTTWGLSFPRGRHEPTTAKYDHDTAIFGASGGASLYRTSMLQQIGLFDDDFFAYYEDMDLSFRAQLAGWKVTYVPTAQAYHAIGQTTKRMPKGFTTYQTLKNLPWLLWKNLPARYLWRVLPRFTLVYGLFFAAAVTRGQGWLAVKAVAVAWLKLPKKLVQRVRIQRSRTVQPAYIWGSMLHDLPPEAKRLRNLRNRILNVKRTKDIS